MDLTWQCPIFFFRKEPRGCSDKPTNLVMYKNRGSMTTDAESVCMVTLTTATSARNYEDFAGKAISSLPNRRRKDACSRLA